MTLRAVHPHEPTIPWPDPEGDMLLRPDFEAIWQCIKSWDINVPDAYSGYMSATGNHVRAILDALEGTDSPVLDENKQLRAALEKIRWLEGVNPTAYKIALDALRR